MVINNLNRNFLQSTVNQKSWNKFSTNTQKSLKNMSSESSLNAFPSKALPNAKNLEFIDSFKRCRDRCFEKSFETAYDDGNDKENQVFFSK